MTHRVTPGLSPGLRERDLQVCKVEIADTMTPFFPFDIFVNGLSYSRLPEKIEPQTTPYFYVNFYNLLFPMQKTGNIYEN